MKLLATTITIGSGASRFTFKQLIRKGMHAVYEQWQFGRLVAYETIRIMSHNGYTVNDTYIAPAESMPSASAWGTHGFTFGANDKVGAIRRLAMMCAKGGV